MITTTNRAARSECPDATSLTDSFIVLPHVIVALVWFGLWGFLISNSNKEKAVNNIRITKGTSFIQIIYTYTLHIQYKNVCHLYNKFYINIYLFYSYKNPYSCFKQSSKLRPSYLSRKTPKILCVYCASLDK